MRKAFIFLKLLFQLVVIFHFNFSLEEILVNFYFLIIISFIILKDNFLNPNFFRLETKAFEGSIQSKDNLILEALLLQGKCLNNLELIEAMHLQLLTLQQQSLGPLLADISLRVIYVVFLEVFQKFEALEDRAEDRF
jgi:hypothetical protein